MKTHLARRISLLQNEMHQAGLDLVVFTDRENLIYYTGALAIECMGIVIPAEGEAVLCCLWLDTAYVREVSGAKQVQPYHYPSSSIGQAIVKAMKSFSLPAPAVGFHKYFVEFGTFDMIRKAFPDMTWHPAMGLTYKIRAVKDDEELAHMRHACAFLEVGMAAAIEHVRPGVTELDVLAEADYAMRKAGSDGATFRQQVTNWSKQLLAHPYAMNEIIENNQPVVVHLGASCQGYTAKMCRTVFLGNIPDETLRIYKLLVKAQAVTVKACKPGAVVSDVYEEVFALIKREGYGNYFQDNLGYGIGIRQTEFYPIVGKGVSHKLEKNMLINVLSPTIYKSGVGGPRVKDIVLVGCDGGELLTHFSREIIRK